MPAYGVPQTQSPQRHQASQEEPFAHEPTTRGRHVHSQRAPMTALAKSTSVTSQTVEQWFRRYGPMVHRRCVGILGDEQRANEATQDVFVQVLRNKESLKAEYPSSLLYRVATNVCLNMIRASKRRPEVANGLLIEALAGLASDTSFVGRIEAMAKLDKLFKREKESTRYIAALFHLDRMTLEEVAGEVGMSVSGVRKRLRRVKTKALEMQRENHENDRDD